MEIPAEIRIKATIQRGAVYYFCNESPQFKSDEPHYYIVLNKDPLTERILYLVCASSQLEKAQRRIAAQKSPESTLVYVSPEAYTHFSKETVISCNSVFNYDLQVLIQKLSEKKLRVCDPLPEDIVKALIAGVLDSPLVERKVKRQLQN